MIAAVDAPPPIVAPAPVIRFAPPAGPLRYRTTHTRPGPAGPMHFGLDKTLAFVRIATGWRATLTVTGLFTDAPPPIAATVQAGLAPFTGVPVTVEVDAGGHVGAVIDGAATWAQVVRSLQATAASLEQRGVPAGPRAGLVAMLEATASLDRDAQDARLREPIADLLGAGVPAIPAAATADALTFRTGADGTPERLTVTLSRRTGLVTDREVVRTVEVPGRTMQLTERTVLLP